MKIYFDLLFIAFIYVFGIDICGFWNTISSTIKQLLTKGKMFQPFGLKPFSCSLCMTFWTGAVYLVATHNLTIANLAFVCLVAMLTPRLADFMRVLSDLLAALIDEIRPKE